MRKEKSVLRRMMPLLVLTMLLSILFGINACAASKTVTMKRDSSGAYISAGSWLYRNDLS